MKIQVLVAAMNQKDHSLIEKMNIQTDALVGNQCQINSVDSFDWKGLKVTYYSFNERGVGLNRNNTLMRANCDVCLFADDDMKYVNGYPKIIEATFESYPKADIIVFNVIERKKSKRYVIKSVKKVRFYNFMRYGAVRIAARLSSIKENAIYFNECFGGGAEYRHGEDTLFLAECLKKGLNIVAVPIEIAELTEERASTWDVGFDEKYFKDQGKLYKVLSRKYWKLLCLQDAIRHKGLYKKKWNESYRLMTRI
ncbi:MAG: hypothetical protein E7338_02855 [Clostridiales bacterium]|nr:hypothetical protein [Clostridiales bacterium]